MQSMLHWSSSSPTPLSHKLNFFTVSTLIYLFNSVDKYKVSRFIFCFVSEFSVTSGLIYWPSPYMATAGWFINWTGFFFWSVGLKEHNPVTAHAPYFDFPTGCRKFKKRDKLYRTFKIRLHRSQLSSTLP